MELDFNIYIGDVAKYIAKTQKNIKRAESRILNRWGGIMRRDMRKLKKRMATKKQLQRLKDPNVSPQAKEKLRKKLNAKRTSASKPGERPFYHTNDKRVTLRNVIYLVNSQTQSVRVGPVKLRGSRKVVTRSGVPALHEFGGVAVHRLTDDKGRNTGRVKRFRYPKRPFVGPAEVATQRARLEIAAKQINKALGS